MRRNVVLSAYNRATEVYVVKTCSQVLFARAIYHVLNALRVSGRVRMQSHASPEKACHLIQKFLFFILYSTVSFL